MIKMSNKEVAEHYASLPKNDQAYMIFVNEDIQEVIKYPIIRMDNEQTTYDGGESEMVNLPSIVEEW